MLELKLELELSLAVELKNVIIHTFHCSRSLLPKIKSNSADQLGALNANTWVSIPALVRFVLNRLNIVVIGISSRISREQKNFKYLSLKLDSKKKYFVLINSLPHLSRDSFPESCGKFTPNFAKMNKLCDNFLA